MTKPLLLVTALALADSEGRLLLARRPEGKDMAGLWEFPGGKVATGETPEEALVREAREELDLALNVKDLVPLTFASHDYPSFHLLMPLFLCRVWKGEARPLEGQKISWVHPRAFKDFPMPPADEPLAAWLQTYFKNP